ncbi:MAG: class I SAM-dependent methyltransferase [Blastocatellia bacterium]
MSRILPFILFLMLCVSLPAQTPGRKVRYMTYDEARPILQTLDEILPAELKGKPPESQAAVWDGWVKAQDVMVRARLRRGDEDTLINFLLFGASFTKQPRITPAELARLKQAQKADAGGETLDARIDDLIRGLAAPGANERLIFLRRLVAHLGHRTATIDGRTKLRQYLIAGLLRVLNEQESYARAIESARLQGGASEEFIERSKLYRSRGLSLDTTLSPNFAIEESLKAMKAGGLLAPGGVRKVAVIGPGLDFTDKAAGYDFYPEQTIQPFALVDSLLRLGLADAGALRLTAFDISPRVLDHLNRAKRRVGYTVQLPHDPNAKWKPEWLSFWKNFGDRIGKPAPAAAVPAGLGDLKLRAVKINPAAVKMIVPADLNIVYQRMSQPENFDLIVATNILVYYDLFEQTLALSNIESMLRPGGSLLSSNALLELPVVKMKSVGYQTVVYSERNDDGDHVVWYQRIE